MTRKLAIFDWNGTILSDTQASLKASNECLALYGKGPIDLATFQRTFHFPIIHFYVENGCRVDDILKSSDLANTTYQKAYGAYSKHCRSRHGARDLLKWLHKNDVTCMILSNYLTRMIEPVLERLRLTPYIHHISANECDGSTILHKTSKLERLSEFMTKRGYAPKNAFIIGDSMEEPEIAHQLSLLSFSITGGCVSEARLKKAGADHIVHQLSALKPILTEKWKLRP